MGLFKRGPQPAIDGTLPDGAWLSASSQLYESTISQHYGSPETIANAGQERYGQADFGTALFFFQKSIDLLHTLYLFSEMRSRQPSPADAWIMDGYVSSLGATLSLHPTAPIDESVREVTHRLRTISTNCERVGLPSQLYRSELDAMASTAPRVEVDDIFWN